MKKVLILIIGVAGGFALALEKFESPKIQEKEGMDMLICF
jgi:hypothetical protein